MGNWRTVTLVGTVDKDEVPKLRDRVTYSFTTSGGFDHFGPLSFDPGTPSLCGLHEWVRPTIAAGGNLAERDYSVEDVAETLRELVLLVPSLELKVHCGGDYESEECVATITAHDGQVTIGPPEVKQVSGVAESDMKGRLLGHLYRP